MLYKSVQLYLESYRQAKPVWGLAWVSFLWSVSSLMMFTILPPFLTEVLQVSHKMLGYMEGIAIGTAFAAKVGSGFLSDRFRARKPFIVIGSIISSLTMPLFALAQSAGFVFVSRFLNRLSKGVRSAPSDALIADLAYPKSFSQLYGVRQALYTLGAVFGAFSSMVLMYFTNNNYRFVFWVATIPALVAVVVLIFCVEDMPRSSAQRRRPWRLSDISLLPPAFWYLLLMTSCLMLARFSEAFLSLKAKDVGWQIAFLPVITIVMDLTHAWFAFQNGRFNLRFSKYQLLGVGFCLLIITDLVLSAADSIWLVGLGVVLNGIHMGITQGILRALIASVTPSHIYGTAFSLFYLVSGVSVMLGNIIAGNLADYYGIYACFLGGFIATVFAFMILIGMPKADLSPATNCID